jgi:hypothetical protein
VKKGGKAFLELYGVRHTDGRFDAAFRDAVRKPNGKGMQKPIVLAPEVAAAMYLRTKGRPVGHPIMSMLTCLAKLNMFWLVEHEWPEIQAKEKRKGVHLTEHEARRKAAEEIIEQEHDLKLVSGITRVETLIDQMKPSRKSRALGPCCGIYASPSDFRRVPIKRI